MRLALAIALALCVQGCAVFWVPCIDGPGIFPPPPSVWCPWGGWGKK